MSSTDVVAREHGGPAPLPAVRSVGARATRGSRASNATALRQLRQLRQLPAAPLDQPEFAFDLAVVGLGYVGLPTALAAHSTGRRILGIDVSARRLDAISTGAVDLMPDDGQRLDRARDDPAFVLSADPGRIAEAACVVVCVPTPVDAHLVPDLSILTAACRAVVAAATPGQLLILTSTSYVGCTRDLLVSPLAARDLVAGSDVFVAFSPERIDPGTAHTAHVDVPRVVGGVTAACTARAVLELGAMVRTVHPVSSPEAAELTKLIENTFRAVNIALANEFAEASRAFGLDVMEVIGAAATKPYGFMAFTPGAGVGGHCIPCDPHYLIWQLRRHRAQLPLVTQAMASIEARPHRVVERAAEVLSSIGRSLQGAAITVVGLAYKPDVQDVRESPALAVIDGLQRAGAVVSYHDPLVANVVLSQGDQLDSVDGTRLADADLLVVHTLHQSFDRALLDVASLVLDATYRLAAAPHVFAL